MALAALLLCVPIANILYVAAAILQRGGDPQFGRMLILEFVPNEDRVSPPVSASFSLMMLANTPAGDAYTMAEYSQMLDAAGFGAREIMDVPRSAQQLIVASA